MCWRIDRAVTLCGLVLCLLAASLPGRALAEGAFLQPAGTPLKVLIISGQGDHDWRATTPFMRRILDNMQRFTVRVCESPAGLTARTLADFDVLVDDYGGPALGNGTEQAIDDFVASGRGLVITHGALGSYTGLSSPTGGTRPDRSESARMVPGYWPATPSTGGRGRVHFFEVKVVRPQHPIAQGMSSGFKTADAPFRGMAIRPGTDVIAVVRDNAENGGSGSDEPVLLACGHGKGRVFCTALGHDLAAMRAKEFVTTFARGTEWAASGTVTLPADLGLPRPNADAVRGLLITGGHDHESSFYALFDGYNDLAGMPVVASATAFQGDLRGKYDVVIMYDFSRDLSATGKKNLRDFVESGNGIVVLHHALLNYEGWPWWNEEVVGGRYRLRRDGVIPSSTVKAAQQLFVTPMGEHPVTAGIGPFLIEDETYKGMWFSPRIRPILSTDNPNSDRSVAWIGPSATSRVVAIQLGHGPSAFGHPKYRALVHNAILWSAGRIK